MKIYYSNPFSIEKNFGKAINDFCELIPNEEDWVVIQDGDMMYLQTNYGKVIYDNIQANKDKFALFGCMTNRLADKAQCHNMEISYDHNILAHLEIAKQYSGTECIEINRVAGVFMAFTKGTWLKVGKFRELERYYAFDSDFCKKVRGNGLKIGLMKGLYVYHQYRPWSNNPQDDTAHLL